MNDSDQFAQGRNERVPVRVFCDAPECWCTVMQHVSGGPVAVSHQSIHSFLDLPVPMILRFLRLLLLAALLAPGATAQSPNEIKLTYLGAAGWIIEDGKVVVLVDPWITRVPYGSGSGHPNDPRPVYKGTDIAPVDTALVDSLITRADFILVHHTHFDHMGDVPYIAKKTGAKVIGTETAMRILRAYGLPDEQLYPVRGGEDYQFDAFSVRVIPSIHSALNDRHYLDSRRYDRSTALQAPLRIDQFIEGGSLMFYARFAQHEVLTMGSMNFVERETQGLRPDILLAGINGSRLGLYRYDARLMAATGNPPVVIPTHWDNFSLPYGFSQQAGIERNLIPFREGMKTIAPSSRVILPVHLEPIRIGRLR